MTKPRRRYPRKERLPVCIFSLITESLLGLLNGQIGDIGRLPQLEKFECKGTFLPYLKSLTNSYYW
jgi:hypothetical protein